MVKKTRPELSKSVMILSDLPAKKDMLGYAAYRDALFSLITDWNTESPLTIGIFGDWGSGKTTLLDLLKQKLDLENINTIWIDVWQFGTDQEIWKAFLQAVLISVKRAMPWYKRLLYHLGIIRKHINKVVFWQKMIEIGFKIAIVIVPLCFSLSALIPTFAKGSSAPQIAFPATGVIGSTVLGWYLIFKPYFKAVKERVSVNLKGLIQSSPLKERVSVSQEFKKFFKVMVKSWVGQTGRLVVFIDDLDRCPPQRIVQVLDAIKLYLDIPNCIFVLGLDREIVEQAVTLKFDKYKDPIGEAREYLEKIISLPFELPPLTGQQMQTLVENLSSNLPDSDRSAPVFAFGQDANPRKVKRTINIFLLLWMLSRSRKELMAAIKPTRLAKIVVIQHSYRDFYILVSLFPKCLGELEAYFRMTENEKGRTAKSALSEIDDAQNNTHGSTLPDYLEPFLNNMNLRKLLTLNPNATEEDFETNFTRCEDSQFIPLQEEEIQPYIILTNPKGVKRSGTIDDSLFINRENELQTFRDLLSDSSQSHIVLLKGEGGMGKSALLKEFGKRFKQEAFFVDINATSESIAATPVSLIKQLGDKLSLTGLKDFNKEQAFSNTAENLTNSLIISLQRKTEKEIIVIVFDSFEVFPEDCKKWIQTNFLASIARNNLRNIIVVISGRLVPDIAIRSEFSSLVQEMPLNPLTVDSIIKTMESLNIKEPEDNFIASLVHAVKGKTNLIREYLEMLRQN